MSASRDREQLLSADEEPTEIPWAERSAFRDSRGITWWMAILVALGSTLIGTLADVLFLDGPRLVSQVIYALGCVLAVALVQRQSLFGPIVQPPLIIGVSFPLILWLTAGPTAGDMTRMLVRLSMPLINAFPVMGITTVLTVGIGLARYFLQREPLRDAEAEQTPTGKKTTDAGRRPAREAGRRADRSETSSRAGAAGSASSKARAEGKGRSASEARSAGRSGGGASTAPKGARASSDKAGATRRPNRPARPRDGEPEERRGDDSRSSAPRRTSAAGRPQGSRAARPEPRAGRPARAPRESDEFDGPSGGRGRPESRRRPPRRRDDLDD
ncbi:hypothetical protein AHOG_03990 [Actinoalloteichus hoggarensis]|uniref:DUF6542 domain-containing protein n=1 Tax=Actinoalloteichus hoggarensis TaxID=1470176 RepID=A0A221VY74_9PSEU|nr:hypothetical protein AHOG_03990 [Actinoalloteichus hoggarensis]